MGNKLGTSVGSCGPEHSERQPSAGVKWETSVKSCPERPERETSVGDKRETHVKACGPEHPERETSMGDKCKIMRPRASRVGDRRQAGDTCKSMRPRAPRVGDKRGRGRQVWETSGRHM